MNEECLICKEPLEYLDTDEVMECELCHKKQNSKTRCVEGHFVCDECHTSGMDEIIALCLNEKSKNPIEILEKIKNPNDKLLKLILLAKFIRNSCRTVINVKEHYITNQQLSIVGDKKKANELIDKMEEILLRERENVLDTIPVVKLDSRLGWEPSMEYTTDEKGLRWKLRQLDYELNTKIKAYRKANSY